MIKNGNIARESDIREALQANNCINSDIEVEIVMPQANPHYTNKLKVKQKGNVKPARAFIRDRNTGRILVHAPSAYALLEKIENGWKDEPKKEGLFK